MTIWLEGRAAGRTVTIRAVASTIRIVRPGATFEGCGGMAGAAIQSSRNVVVILTCRGNPMAGRAIINDAGMIEHRASEAKREFCGMTNTAILVCL